MPRFHLERSINVGPGYSAHMREAAVSHTSHVDSVGRSLYFAARAGDLPRVHEALVNGARNGGHFNWGNPAKCGQTALMAAAGAGHAHCTELILEAGAFALSTDSLKNTALHHAAWAGHLDCTDKLLEHRPTTGSCDVHAKNAAGQTPLMCAAQHGNPEVVARLIEVGAALDARDNDGNTAAHYAGSEGHIGAVQVLLESGARGDFVNCDGLTALDLARYNGSTDTADYLDQNVAQAPIRPSFIR